MSQAQRPRRKRATRRSVKIAEVASRLFITVGGIATIGAVALIFVFLVSVVVPLLSSAETSQAKSNSVEALSVDDVLHFRVDEYRLLAALILEDGSIHVHRLDTGERLETLTPFEGSPPTAISSDPAGERLGLGFADGSVRLASFGFRVEFPDPATLSSDLLELEDGELAVHEGGLLQLTADGRPRVQRFEFELEDPVETSASTAIRLMAHSSDGGSARLCMWTEAGRLVYAQAEQKLDFMTGETRTRLNEWELSGLPTHLGDPKYLRLSGLGDTVFIAWENGDLLRFDARDPGQAVLAESFDLVPEPDQTLTALQFLTGKSTLISGDSAGAVRAWFLTKPEGAVTSDGATLVLGHELANGGAPVTSLAPSARSRLLAAGRKNGTVDLFYVTSEERLVTASTGKTDAIGALPMLSANPKSKRLEFRSPDPTCNPYLGFSAMLMAGLDGIANRIDPGDPVDDVDLFEIDPHEHGYPVLPGSLGGVLDALEEDHDFLLQGEVFDEDLIRTWIDYKRENEVAAVDIRPHPHEFSLYFDA